MNTRIRRIIAALTERAPARLWDADTERTAAQVAEAFAERWPDAAEQPENLSSDDHPDFLRRRRRA